jgi:hypothetical protein
VLGYVLGEFFRKLIRSPWLSASSLSMEFIFK